MIKLYKYSYFTETKRCEDWLEEMALKGWMVEQFTRNLDFVRFRKDESKVLHYCFYFNDLRQLDEESLIVSAKEQSWINLNKNPILAGVFLFVSTDPNPKPLETDLYEQENMYRSSKKKLSRFEVGLLCAAIFLIILNVNTSGWWFMVSPVLWYLYTRMFWMLELMFKPKQYNRFSDRTRRMSALIFRGLRFSIIPIWILLLILIQMEILPLFN